jgi:RNA polymerase sigma-70 factor (ECF subfamily)
MISDSREEQLVHLLSTHKRQLFGYIFALVHSIADAEDVFQQTSLVLWEKFDEFEPGTDFVAWAASIARYKAIDFLRSLRRQRASFSPILLDQLTVQAHARSELAEARAMALESCRLKLSSADQQTLRACYAQGVTIKQAAVTLDRSVGSVYDSLSRIRRALLKCIERTLLSEGCS